MSERDVHQCKCLICQSESDHLYKLDHHRMNLLISRMDEQQRRWFAALEAQRYGYGGVKYISKITGINEKTIRRGIKELESDLTTRPSDRIRLKGAGRQAVEKKCRK